ncbi:zinc-dependent metalloprotease family protein [Flavobacterium rivuli]|uniref:zinc-dependent metalloprotease family protein n=1 Tax=Flavobacterium rivuli TaxID=498301 RepID=UPI000380819C|nr:zinc-dependent metalloprotease family protein [Flavobacterium rivuli]
MKPHFVYFALFLIVLLGCSKSNTFSKETTVGVVPYKGMSAQKIDELTKAITSYYGVTVKILRQKTLPKSAFINIKSPRYRADSIIAIQERNMPEGVDYILGLTTKDVSVTKHDGNGNIKHPEWRYNDFGIMGLAYCPGKSCIVSDFRLKTNDKDLHLARFKKVVIHELGHNFGLPHCPNKKCVMTDAVESIKTIDNADPGVCNACRKKLRL